MIHRFRKVTKDLYRGSAPSPVDIIFLKTKLGIKKIISLDAFSGQKIHNITHKLGIKHIIIPITSDKSSLTNLFHYNLKKLLLKDGPTFIHCAAGKDRTGLVVAIIKCKYFHEDPEKAISEAKSLGFGVGIDPKITHLYESLIRCCKINKDSNNADIVSNEREYIDDNKGTFLPPGQQGSFAPYLDQTKSFPNDFLYLSDLEELPSKNNISDLKKNTIKFNNEYNNTIPAVGLPFK